MFAPVGYPGGEGGNHLDGARLTLSGRAIRLQRDIDEAERTVFLECHSSAKMCSDLTWRFSFF